MRARVSYVLNDPHRDLLLRYRDLGKGPSKRDLERVRVSRFSLLFSSLLPSPSLSFSLSHSLSLSLTHSLTHSHHSLSLLSLFPPTLFSLSYPPSLSL
jgi:hypothetical protein